MSKTVAQVLFYRLKRRPTIRFMVYGLSGESAWTVTPGPAASADVVAQPVPPVRGPEILSLSSSLAEEDLECHPGGLPPTPRDVASIGSSAPRRSGLSRPGRSAPGGVSPC